MFNETDLLGLPDPERVRGLIDHAVMEAATTAAARAVQRRVQAGEALEAATAAHKAAEMASRRAVAGEGKLKPLDAEAALEAAERGLRVAEKVAMAAEDAARKAEAERVHAIGVAWQPVYADGISRRLAAARKADAAKAMLAEAQADHDAATALLNRATQMGTQHLVFDQSHHAGTPVRGYEDELHRWMNAHPGGWWPGLGAADQVAA